MFLNIKRLIYWWNWVLQHNTNCSYFLLLNILTHGTHYTKSASIYPSNYSRAQSQTRAVPLSKMTSVNERGVINIFDDSHCCFLNYPKWHSTLMLCGLSALTWPSLHRRLLHLRQQIGTINTLMSELNINTSRITHITHHATYNLLFFNDWGFLFLQVSRPLYDKSYHKKLQSRKVFTHRESFDTIIAKTEEKLLQVS